MGLPIPVGARLIQAIANQLAKERRLVGIFLLKTRGVLAPYGGKIVARQRHNVNAGIGGFTASLVG